MKYNSLLPIGSVVKVQGSEQLFLVVGANIADPVTDRVFDYRACFYPVGYTAENRFAAFDHTDIEEIYAVGYLDEESRSFQIEAQKLNQYLRDHEGDEAQHG